jgi:flagellum-specific peptidoglycan hydrolase FlgJ
MQAANMTTDQAAFIAKVGALAHLDMGVTGVLASLTLAQAILESGWGKSRLAREGNALFGIKAGKSWTGPRMDCKTFEHYDGKRTDIVDAFRAYGSWAESVADHGAFLRGLERYKAVIGERDYKKACKAIHAAGYATDPGYADKLIGLIEQYGLTKYDGESAAQPPVVQFEVGDRARVKPTATHYEPGVKMASFVPGSVYTVNGAAVRGGRQCVRLKEITTWCAVENLTKVEG